VRTEFIISNIVKIHPLALTRYRELHDRRLKGLIDRRPPDRRYADRTDYFVERLARGIAMIAASRFPRPVIVRLSDFKSNEYANLIGGAQFEPREANPMLGFRGASRYYSDAYADGFALECRAIKMTREEIGLTNVIAMVPFCHTPEEADDVLAAMAANGGAAATKGSRSTSWPRFLPTSSLPTTSRSASTASRLAPTT
jgi:pyruvate,water dikinase